MEAGRERAVGGEIAQGGFFGVDGLNFVESVAGADHLYRIGNRIRLLENEIYIPLCQKLIFVDGCSNKTILPTRNYAPPKDMNTIKAAG